MNAGILNTLVEIQVRDEVQSATGSLNPTYVPIANTPRIWAHIKLMRMREGVTPGNSMAEAADFEIRAHWRGDLRGAMRLVAVDTGEIYDITGTPTDPDGTRKNLLMYAVKRSTGPHA